MTIITNIVGNFSIGKRLSYEEFLSIARKAPNCEYKLKRFHAIIMKLRYHTHDLELRTATALIFGSARVIVTNAGKSFEDVKRVARSVRRRINFALDSPRNFSCLLVTNIVCSINFNKRINLHLLLQKHKAKEQKKINQNFQIKLHYDNTIFPGLICRMQREKKNENVRSIIFCSGKIILTGLKSFLDICFFEKKILEMLDENEKRKHQI